MWFIVIQVWFVSPAEEKSHICHTNHISFFCYKTSLKGAPTVSRSCTFLSFAHILLPFLSSFPHTHGSSVFLPLKPFVLDFFFFFFDWFSIHSWWCFWSMGWVCFSLLQFTEHESSWKLTRLKDHPPPIVCSSAHHFFALSTLSTSPLLLLHCELSSFGFLFSLLLPLLVFFSLSVNGTLMEA